MKPENCCQQDGCLLRAGHVGPYDSFNRSWNYAEAYEAFLPYSKAQNLLRALGARSEEVVSMHPRIRSIALGDARRLATELLEQVAQLEQGAEQGQIP